MKFSHLLVGLALLGGLPFAQAAAVRTVDADALTDSNHVNTWMNYSSGVVGVSGTLSTPALTIPTSAATGYRWTSADSLGHGAWTAPLMFDYGSSTPSAGLGNLNDSYIDTSTGGFYQKQSVAGSAVAVAWTNRVNATDSPPGTLNSTSAGSGLDSATADAPSQTVTSGNAASYCQTAESSVRAGFSGFVNTWTPASYTSLVYAFLLNWNGSSTGGSELSGHYSMQENGVQVGATLAFSNGDVLCINVSSTGTVTYTQNVGTVYTSSQAPIFPLWPAASLYTNAASTYAATFTTASSTWINLSSSNATPNTLALYDSSGNLNAAEVLMTGFNLSTGASTGYVLTSDGAGNGTWQPGGAGPTGVTGPSGADGSDGPTGVTGTTGTQFYTQSGAPAGGLGNEYDLDLDTSAFNLYVKQFVSSGLSPVSWTDIVGASASGGTLTNTAGSPSWTDSGAQGTASISSGAAAQYCISPLTTDDTSMSGFTNSWPSVDYVNVQFGLVPNNSGGGVVPGDMSIFESGAQVGSIYSFSSGDLWCVNVSSGGVVSYSQNGTTVYTSSQTPSFPLFPVATILDPGGVVRSAEVSTSGSIEWVSQGSIVGPTGPSASPPLSMNTGFLSTLGANEFVGIGHTPTAVTLTYAVAVANTLTCSTNPTFTLYDCGSTSSSCSSGTALTSITLTAASTPVDGTISVSTIPAGDYWAWLITAGTCTALDATGTAQ